MVVTHQPQIHWPRSTRSSSSNPPSCFCDYVHGSIAKFYCFRATVLDVADAVSSRSVNGYPDWCFHPVTTSRPK